MTGFSTVGQGGQVDDEQLRLETLTLFCDDTSKYPSIAVSNIASCKVIITVFGQNGAFEVHVESYDSNVSPDYGVLLRRAKSPSRSRLLQVGQTDKSFNLGFGFSVHARSDEFQKILVIV